MSADTPDTTPDERVPSQDSYEEQTADTRWVELNDVDGEFQVREIPPLRLLRSMETHNVGDLLNAAEGDEVDMQKMVTDGDFGGFLEDTVLPNIITPDCYWSDIGDGDWDLSALTPDDLMVVITGMTGQDRDDLEEQADNRFQG